MTRQRKTSTKTREFPPHHSDEGRLEPLASPQEGANAEIAREIRDLRTEAGLTQRELAGRVGTTASVICRLEDADYEGHSLAMLQRIAAALGKRVEIRFADVQAAPDAPNGRGAVNAPDGHAPAPLADVIPGIAGLDREALRQAAEAHGLDLVVLFGSTAKGRRRAGSDLDIAIRFAGPRREDLAPWEEEGRAANALFEVLQPRCELDVVSLNRASPLLKWNVAQHGIVLFSATPATWTLFRIHARHDFEDNARFRKRRWQLLLRRLGHDAGGQ